MSAFGEAFTIPGVYRRPTARAEGFPRVRTDIAGFVGVAGPSHVGEAIAVDDWKSYVARFRRDALGSPIDAPRGGALENAVRDYFANGGRRLWIVNVAERIDPERSDELLNNLLGLNGDDRHPCGLELLLRQDEVSIVAIPDLDAKHVVTEDRHAGEDLPPNPCFGACNEPHTSGAATSKAVFLFEERLFSDDDLMWAQRYLIQRLQRTRWRWFALLAPPPGLTADRAIDWRQRLSKGDDEMDMAGLYWPWLLAQDAPGATVRTVSPVGAVAGIFAAVDIAMGPHAAPANQRVEGTIGLDMPVGDDENSATYEAGVNVLRDFPGRGILLWGARTLKWKSRASRGEPLAYVNARRCLSAIARTCDVIGQPIVFQPNNTFERIKLHQLLTDYLLRVFRTGALMGDAPDQAFFVKVETIEDSPEGQMIALVGVALAAPAEFIVFRVGRETGVIEGEARP
ncbi:MAG: phage tail sheath subtilisin-like domain-containing protein [Hyphomicrobium sp.]